MDAGAETRLARFNGTSHPSDVTSVIHTAWMNLHTTCMYDVFQLNMKVTSENHSGMYHVMSIQKLIDPVDHDCCGKTSTFGIS